MRSFIFSLAIMTAMSGTLVSVSAVQASEDTAKLIASNLKQSGKLKDYRVGVKYEDGVAWLMGTVTSPQQKQIAERLARQTDGVQHVVSKLEIEGATSSDADVKTASKEVPAEAPISESRPSELRKPATRTSQRASNGNMPLPYARTAGPQQGVQPANFRQAQYAEGGYMPSTMAPQPMGPRPAMAGGAAVSYDNPQMPGYAWPSYAASPNYAALTYPKQYSASAWPYIGPFYPYPQVPLGWRRVSLEWDDGWWFLDFTDNKGH
ncbi:MAG: BON domain-containing protein [Planctomycetota bacterium]